MKLEIVKFYETARDDAREYLIGTLHIRLPEFGLNIKGVHVFRKKNDYWFIGLPNRKAFDKTLGKEISYSLILFDEKEKNTLLIDGIRNEGRKFVENYLKDNPQTPETQSQATEAQKIFAKPKPHVEQQKRDGGNVKQKKAATQAPNPSKIAATKWQDPPKRTSTFTRKPAYGKR